MDKKEQLEFLANVEKTLMQKLLAIEIDCRLFSAKVMLKANQTNLAAQGKVEETRTELKNQLRYCRELIKEVKEGKYEV